VKGVERADRERAGKWVAPQKYVPCSVLAPLLGDFPAISPLSEGRCVPKSYAIGKINTCSESAAQALQEYVTLMDRAYIAWMEVSAHD